MKQSLNSSRRAAGVSPLFKLPAIGASNSGLTPAARQHATLGRSRLLGLGLVLASLGLHAVRSADPKAAPDAGAEFTADVQPLVKRYCLDCHSTKAKKGSLDLERFATLDLIRKDVKPWLQTIEMLETGEMPPKGKPQPSAAERDRLTAWIRRFLDAEARARAGDPGHVPLRRLSNAEYDATIRELTGVDLRPTREFPADGAAGEGFTNAAEALTDISPALLTKYLNAAKEIAERAVLLPDGLRFSPSKTRRDWTNEGTAQLRQFYAAHAPADGKLPVQPYLRATVRHRDALAKGQVATVAAQEKLNPKYLGALWQALTDQSPAQPLAGLRARWAKASEQDVPGLTAEVAGWQAALWKSVKVGNYVQESWGAGPNAGKRYAESLTRQVAVEPPAAATLPLRLGFKPAAKQSEVVLYLDGRSIVPTEKEPLVVWHQPRFEKAGQPPLLLRNYADFGPALEPAEAKERQFGLDRERFGKHPAGQPADEASLVVPVGSVVEVRLPAALFRDREFVVDARLDGVIGDRVVQCRVLTTPPTTDAAPPDARLPILATPDSAGYRQFVQGCAAFRKVFPLFICFPPVVPTDEVVTLKMFHREDEPLLRLFLDDEQRRQLDHLWDEQRFISRQPVAEWDYLPQFMAYTTQDTPKEFQQFFIDRKPLFKQYAEEFEKDEAAALPKQLDALLAFADKAYRRPLQPQEQADLRALYAALRQKGTAHDEAFRGVLARILAAPAFLFRVEKAPAGTNAGPVNDWELATRLSYFLWSCGPDESLRQLAAAGQLREPQVLEEQARKMLKDERVRALAIEFGAQWLHVRGFDEFNEKNEKLFPTFDARLRQAIYEETILFFQDLFQHDRPVAAILDADYTFLNDTLAKHYGIAGVTGPQFRRVEGVKKYGRGGILGLASVQAKQSGASRTSPVLRGNWVVETLLGEKLPRPPANVPQLPEVEGADKLTTRQLVEKHASVQECALCHQRIDPFGFALERYDAIGRRRDQDLGGLAVDARAKLKDGTEFDGLDGLRNYLLTKKQDVIVKLFCRKLLGYALGRAVTLSDQSLIDEMVVALNRNEGRLSAAVLTIVRSPQFRMMRGRDFEQ
ncbi:MAG: DUF1592 domain-containing protein [Planctomycetia bacterium]|nr:DUF1592 domain-containing protein [Planctomycetia bacterium]